jgi:hypothetical protein
MYWLKCARWTANSRPVNVAEKRTIFISLFKSNWITGAQKADFIIAAERQSAPEGDTASPNVSQGLHSVELLPVRHPAIERLLRCR